MHRRVKWGLQYQPQLLAIPSNRTPVPFPIAFRPAGRVATIAPRIGFGIGISPDDELVAVDCWDYNYTQQADLMGRSPG
jgi:hypothetical protein